MLTYREAAKIARAWIAVRSDVRRALIAEAKRRHQRSRAGYNTRHQNELRKLRRFSGDLSEGRLLALAEGQRRH